VILGLLLAVAALPAARAAPPATAQTEINYLLRLVQTSGCEFYRNGTWFDASKAQTHLREKYQFLAQADRIHSAEDFIEQAATKSSLSGQPYQVRCGGGEPVTTNQWLRAALVALRKPAPGAVQKSRPQ
jgi:hypothetical protein